MSSVARWCNQCHVCTLKWRRPVFCYCDYCKWLDRLAILLFPDKSVNDLGRLKEPLL